MADRSGDCGIAAEPSAEGFHRGQISVSHLFALPGFKSRVDLARQAFGVRISEFNLFNGVAVEVLAVGIAQAQGEKARDGRYSFVGVPCMERRRPEITALENDCGFSVVMLSQRVADALRLSGDFVKF